MEIKELRISVALSTKVTVEKAQRIADESGVTLTLVDVRMGKGRQWLNDFEVEGQPGKVDAFLAKIKDVEM